MKGFAVESTTARANGTMWDLALKMTEQNSDDCRIESSPELLAGSPPSDDLSSLLNNGEN